MQLIAMLTMLIDHIGAVYYPYDLNWRLIGRIAFPIYAYAIVAGYGRTRSVNRYMWRLLLIAAAAQLPYSATFGVWEVNAVGTLLVSLAVLALLDRFDKRGYRLVLAYWPQAWAAAERMRSPAWLWRSFYPAHLAALALLQLVN